MAKFVRLTCEMTIRGVRVEVSVAPLLATWLNAQKGRAGSRNQIIGYQILPALSKLKISLTSLEWHEITFTVQDAFEGEPHATVRGQRSRRIVPARIPDAQGNPDCRCDLPGRCPVHDS